MKLHLSKTWLAVVLAACITHTAQAVTVTNPYSITLEDGTTTFTAAAEIPGDGENPATPAVTLTILTSNNKGDGGNNSEVANTGATYTVLASTATDNTTNNVGRFYINTSGEATNISNMGTLIIASGTYQTEENGTSQNFYGGQLKLVGQTASYANIIIGSETYTESWENATDAQKAGYSSAIQFTHNGKLTGSNLTLVADSQIGIDASNGTSKAYIENAIHGEGKSLALLTDHAGNAIHLSGGASLKTLSGTANVVLDDRKSNNSTAAGSKAYTMNNITGTGTMTIDSDVTLTLLGDTSATGNTVTSSKNMTLTGTLKLGDDSDTQRYISLTGGITKSDGSSPDILIRKKVDVSVSGSVSANKIKFGEKINNNHINSEAILRIKDGGSLTASTDLDMTNGTDGSKAKVIFEKGSTGSVNRLWMAKYTESEQETYVDVANGASLTLTAAGVTISGSTSGKTARITRTSDQGEFRANVNKFAISDAKVTVDNSDGKNISLTLSGVYSLENAISEAVTESNSANTAFASVAASEGDIIFQNKTNGISINELSISDNKSVSVYSGDSNSALTTLTVGSSLKATGIASINGALVLKDGATLNLADSITLANNLTLGSGLSLSNDMITTLGSSNSVTLFTGVTGITGWASEGTMAAADIFRNTEFAENGIYDSHVVAYKGGVVSIYAVPEPTTATLSLLALAGLAARRRRK